MASSAGSPISLIKAVLDVVAEHRTGVLEVRSDGVRTRIYFDDGKPVFADDEAAGETFGRLLMRQGVLTSDQFVRVIDEMTRAATGDTQLRFGEVAVALDVLTPGQVEHGLAEQVRGIIARSLQRTPSQWAFEPSPPAAKPPRSFSLEIAPVILAAIRQSSDRSMFADLVAARPEELVVIAGTRPAADVREESHVTPPETRAARMAAEQAFQKGLALLRETKTASAAVELRRASELQPESLEYLLYATWAKALTDREIPSESDRQELLEIAQRAKRRDPMFAFGSYVIGQVAMWAGDDATAKKWFYEALRLDPTSDAGKQVRILARHGPEAPPAAGGEGPSNRDETLQRPHVPTSEPPPLPAEALVQASKAIPTARAPASRGGKRAATGVVLFATAAIVGLAVATKSAPTTGPMPRPSSQPALVVDAAASVDAQGAEASAPPEGGGAAASAATERESGDAEMGTVMGTVVLPSRAAGHRIFVDGRRAKADGTAPLRLPCGAHDIQIGSAGTPEHIDLPCGGKVQIE